MAVLRVAVKQDDRRALPRDELVKLRAVDRGVPVRDREHGVRSDIRGHAFGQPLWATLPYVCCWPVSDVSALNSQEAMSGVARAN